jgi:23S rRNA pseudouridine1911/1915/1917 synthase
MAPTEPPKELVVAEPVERLDRYLARHCPGLSRAAIQRLIREGQVRLNGAPAKASQVPAAGDLIQIEAQPTDETPPAPQPLALEIVYEDDELLVLNKPAGLVVHPGAGHPDQTLVNALLAHRPEVSAADIDPNRPGIVHRLDRDTSGLLLVALTRATQAALQAQFKARTVDKIYQALVYGHLSPPEAMIEAPLARDPQQRQRMAGVGESGRPALTRYRASEYYQGATLAEVTLLTGRTHQIRVHMASIGYPVVGDRVYGPRRQAIAAPRQMLHAWRLSFDHPTRGERLTFTAEIPEDMARVLARLRAAA